MDYVSFEVIMIEHNIIRAAVRNYDFLARAEWWDDPSEFAAQIRPGKVHMPQRLIKINASGKFSCACRLNLLLFDDQGAEIGFKRLEANVSGLCRDGQAEIHFAQVDPDEDD